MTTLGELALWMTVLLSGWTLVAASSGGATAREELVESASRGLRAAAGFALISLLVLARASWRSDYGLRFVAAHQSQELSAPFRLSATWAGAGGMLLVGCAVFAMSAVLADIAAGRAQRRARAAHLAVFAAVLTALAAAALVSANPCVQLAVPAVDGHGLAPSLHSWPAALDVPLLAFSLSAAGVAATFALVPRDTGRPVGTAQGAEGLRSAIIASVALIAVVALRAHRAYNVDGAKPGARGLFGAATGSPYLAAIAVAALYWCWRYGPRRRVGLMLGAIAVVVAGSALLGVRAARESVVVLPDGAHEELRDPFGTAWSFTSQGVSRIERPTFLLTAVALMVARDHGPSRFLTVEVREYDDGAAAGESPVVERPALWRSLGEDARIRVTEMADSGVTFAIEFLPLISLLWVGLAALTVAVPVTSWPAGGSAR